MRIDQVKEAAELCFKSNVTLCLVGVSGCGKTSIWKQIYKDLGFDNYLILRPSLIADAGDLVGLPNFKVVEGSSVTEYCRPDWLPSINDKTLIVLDEFNRIQKDVANAIFGLIEAESPTVGKYTLPKGCKVVATGNPPTDNYGGVLDLNDSAWTSRLCYVKIQPEFQSFKDYAKYTGKISSTMIDFLIKNNEFFGVGEDFDVEMFGLNFKDNNRSKEKVSKLDEVAEELGTSDLVLFECIKGIGGSELANAFINFKKDNKKNLSFDHVFSSMKNIEKFDYTQMSNISKLINDIEIKIDKSYFNESDKFDILVSFLNKIPLDTFKAFLYTVGSISINETISEDKESFLENLGNNKIITERAKEIIK